MKTLQFKTNINCRDCVAKVSPQLNQEKDIRNWRVDTDNPNKILFVETEHLTAQQVIESLKKTGFKAEIL